jgi:hypothetical protein
MTRQRHDKHGTEFGLWLRKQDELDSKHGYVATNLDYIWENYKTGDWMLIEEKRHMAKMTFSQRRQLERVHKALMHSRLRGQYRGIHLLQFENTSPDDGKIFWDNKQIDKSELINILRFQS